MCEIDAALGKKLALDQIKLSDPAFSKGMAADGVNLNDPPQGKWDDLFKNGVIDGVFKIAGNSPGVVDSKLSTIKSILGSSIKEINWTSPPTTSTSRIDGQVRPDKNRGHEQ